MTQATAQEQNEREIVITREFDAPRQLLWEVWTQPAHMEKWFGPRGFSTRVDKHEFRPGGRMEYVMIGPDGAEYPGTGVFQEIDPPQKLVTTDEFGEDYIKENPDVPQGMVVTTLFEDLGERCRVTIKTMHPTVEDKQKHEEMGVIEGWQSSFECLDDYLAEIRND